MAQINVIGYVAQDIVPKQSQKGTAYVHFFFKENTGNSRNQSYLVWCGENTLPKLQRLKIKKGSLIWVTGSLELVDKLTKEDQETTKMLKIYCNDLGIIRINPLSNSSAEPRNAESTPKSFPDELDGDRNQLPK